MTTARDRYWLRRLAPLREDNEAYALALHEMAGDRTVYPDAILETIYGRSAQVVVSEYILEEALRRAKNISEGIKLPSQILGDWQAWVWKHWLEDEDLLIEGVALMLLAYRSGEVAYRED